MTIRIVVSELAKLFDPLGIVALVIAAAKTFVQELWHLYLSWTMLCNELTELHDLQFLRHMFSQEIPSSIQIYALSDDSEKAHGAAILLRAILMDKRPIGRLFCCRLRVKPIKKQTLPRFELCDAVFKCTANS